MGDISTSANAAIEPASLLIDLVPDLTGGLLSDDVNVPIRGYVLAAHALEVVELIVEGETVGRVVHGKTEPSAPATLPDGAKLVQHVFEFNLRRSKGKADGPRRLTIRAVASNGFVQEEPFELMLAPTEHPAVRRLAGPALRLENRGHAAPPPILLCVDRAVIDAHGTLLLQGWSVAMEPLVSIRVRLGEGRTLEARLGYQRDDVALHHGAYPNAPAAGFALAAPLSADERRATARLCVQTIAASGLCQEAVLPILASSRTEQLAQSYTRQQVIHHFWDEASVTALGELHVEGWAVCAMGIAEVAVHLDGECLGKAVLGLPRPDVGRQFEAIATARSAGFRWHHSLAGIAAGQHDVRLVIRNVLGDEQSQTKQLQTVGAAPPVVAEPRPSASEAPEFHFQLDSPLVVHGAAVEPVIGRLAIEGWVLCRSGVAEIEVRLDEIPAGVAEYGLARQDVGIAYPDWQRSPHSGFAFHVPPSALREGQRLVKLIVRSRNGQELVEHVRIDVRTAEDVDDPVGVRQPPGDGSSRFEQLLPTLLPTLVDQTYRAVLCRPVDADGLRRYVHLLTHRKIDLRGLVDVVYESPEYLTVIGPATEQVRSAYRFLFEREPTQTEIYNHVQAFRGTCGSDDEAISAFQAGGTARARLGIRPIKIEMDITNQCNIRCIMCPFSDPAIGGRKRSDLGKETFLRWADEMFSWAAQVGLMFGTEPTLNPNLVFFVRIAKEYRVPNVYFSTNAMKLTPALTGELIEAGLDEFNVSLDAGTKATFERIRRGAKWDIVVGNLKSLRDQKAARKLSRPRLHLSFVMMRSNIQELPQFVELAAELGASVVYCTHLVSYRWIGDRHRVAWNGCR